MTITIALPKGRLLEESIKILNDCGYNIDLTNIGRKLTIGDDIKILLVKPFDVPVYVEYGIADVGIVGKDVILERMVNVLEPIDLKFGKCSLVLATKKDSNYDNPIDFKDKKIGTSYPNVTRKYFESYGISVDIIELRGSVELGAIMDLVDGVVDITSTGKTLEENNLKIIEKIIDISARFIINRISYKTKFKTIENFIKNLKEVEEL